jgi:cytochrome oxidase Cu insertion factor (SCO1/SenC/PrrC family)
VSRARVVLAAAAAAIAVAAQVAPAAPAHPGAAPAFTLPLLSGGTVSSTRLAGRPLILLFWAPW